MKRICAAICAILLLTGCSDSDIAVSTAKYYVEVRSHNGYVISGYSITEEENGSYLITVIAEKGGDEG